MINFKMVFILLLLNSYHVNAITLEGDASGYFPVSEGETALLKWGFGFDGQSSLQYTAVNGFLIDENKAFKIGSLTYTNAEIISDSSLFETALRIQLDFVGPASIGTVDFNYELAIDETNNNNAVSADSVTLTPVAGASSFLAHVNNLDYAFELLGFSSDGVSFDNVFDQLEYTSSTVNLYAKITAVPIPSALWLFMTALSGFIITGNRKRK